MARDGKVTHYAEDLDAAAISYGACVLKMTPTCHPMAGVFVGYQRSGQRLHFYCARCDEKIGRPIAVARNPRGFN